MDEVAALKTLLVTVQNKKLDKNVLNSCRVCMKTCSKGGVMCNIFDNSCDFNIPDKILYCTGIQFTKDDGLPPVICEKCLQDLSIAHSFKRSCMISYAAFQNLMKNEVKVEVDDGSVDNEDWEVNDDDDNSVKEEYIDNNSIKEEYIDNNSIKEEYIDNNEVVKESVKETKPRQKRGPYKKSGKPRLKKLKFRRLYCEPCSLKFTTKSQLEKHRKESHVKNGDSWVCEVCGKLFTHRGSLSSHMRTHLPPEFACDRCDYKTANKYDLTKHLRIHDGDKRFQCQHCSASYHTSSNLSSHIRHVHVKEKKFSCELCDKKFFDRTKCARHIDSHNNVKRFECEVCHSCFTRRCYWKKHLLRQHNIVIPPQRPGRARLNVAVGASPL